MRKLPLIEEESFYSFFQSENLKALSLIIKKRDVNSFDKRGCNPLILATQHGKKRLVCFLLENGANPNVSDKGKMSPLYNACAVGRLEIVRALIKKGAHINGNKRHNPLIIAACYNHYKVIEFLLTKGAKIIKNPEGRTARFFAYMYQNKKVAKLLEQYGSNEKLIDSHGFTPQEAYANDMKD